MAIDEELPRKGERIRTAEGVWEVVEVILLGRAPLHFAVRVSCTAAQGGTYPLLLTRSEYLALKARATVPGKRGR